MAETSTLDKFLAFAAPHSFEALQRYKDNAAGSNVVADYGQATGPEDIRFIQQSIPTYGVKTPEMMKALGVEGTDLIKRFQEGQQEQATPILDKFAADYYNIAGPDKRFLVGKENQDVLRQYGLNIPSDSANPYVQKGIQDFAKQGQLESDLADNFANPGDPNVLARLAANPLAQAQHNIVGTLQTSQDKAQTRADAQAKEGKADTALQNFSGFQSAIAGLDQQSKSPLDLARFSKTGGYDPQGENDIRMAAADYNVPAEAVNKEIDNYRQQMEKTPTGAPYTKNLSTGNATSQQMFQDFVLGGPKQIGSAITNHPRAAPTTVNVAGPGAVSSDAQAILAGRMAPKALSKRGGYDAKVRAEVLQQNPNFDFVKADANAAYAQNSSNLNSRALIQGVEPLYNQLLEAGKALGNSNIPGVNKVKNWYKEATGQPEIVAFNNLRDDVIAESERVLLGSGVLSDSKYMRAVKNVSSAASMPQLNAAVRQLRLTVKSRLEALDKQPFPNQQNQKAEQPAKGNIAPAGLKAKLPNGSVVTSDGKGGWE